MILLDYRCRACQTLHESLEFRPPPDTRECPWCGGEAERVISPVRGKVKVGEVTRGKSDERPAHVLNTEPLASGVSKKEWTQRELKRNRDIRRKQIKEWVS